MESETEGDRSSPDSPKVVEAGLPSTPGFKRFPLSPPTISPKLEPYEPQSPLTSDNDDDDLPKIEDLLASTRPDFTPKQSQTQVRMQNSFSKNGRSSLSSQSANRERDGTTLDVDDDSSSPAAGSSSRPARPTPSNSPQKTDMPKTPVNVSGIPSSALSASGSTQSQPLSARPKPQAKRKRAELEEPPTQTPTTSAKRSKTGKLLQFRKHSTYWLLDGNVILQIKKYRFKLHRSRLVKYSALFDKMFESQRDIEEVVEGYPLYPLDKFGIELEDFETLLDGLDDAITFYYTPPPFPTVASILRASTALSFLAFSAWSTRYLQEMFPPDLEHTSLVKRIPWATEAVVLARKCDVKKVLKRALYELVRMEGFGQDIDDVDAGVLLQMDYRALLKAREKLTSFWLLTAASPSNSFNCPLAVPAPVDPAHPAPPPANLGPCPTAKPSLSIEKHAKLVHASGLFEEYLFDPVCGMQALMDAPWAEEGYCAGCVGIRRDAWGKARAKVWQNLSIWFGLDED